MYKTTTQYIFSQQEPPNNVDFSNTTGDDTVPLFTRIVYEIRAELQKAIPITLFVNKEYLSIDSSCFKSSTVVDSQPLSWVQTKETNASL